MPVWIHTVLTAITEIFFLSGALYCVHRAQKRRIYPAFWQFLVFLLATAVLFLGYSLANGLYLVSDALAYSIYFYTYWISFGIQAVLILRVLHEMFRHAMRSVPGMQKLGRPIFFWAVAVSVILACASGLSTQGSAMGLLLTSAQVLMRSQSVLALCMLAFLAMASHAMGISFRSRIFGVTFGFGMIATGDLVCSGIFAHISGLTGMINIIHEVVYLSAITLWGAYFLQPEPARRLVAVPVSSPLMRWNEIAQSLGNPAGQVAVSYSPTFMTDVFQLVNTVMGPSGLSSEAKVQSPTHPSHG